MAHGKRFLKQKQPLFPTRNRVNRQRRECLLDSQPPATRGTQAEAGYPQGTRKWIIGGTPFLFFLLFDTSVFLLDFIINPSDNSWLNCYLSNLFEGIVLYVYFGSMGLVNGHHDHELPCRPRATCKPIHRTVTCPNSVPAAPSVLAAWLNRSIW